MPEEPEEVSLEISLEIKPTSEQEPKKMNYECSDDFKPFDSSENQ